MSDKKRTIVKAIIIHNTEGSTVDGALSSGDESKDGTNFYIDSGKGKGTDGQIVQAADLNTNTNHVGKTREKGKTLNLSNTNTIGIEFVAKFTISVDGKYPEDSNKPKVEKVVGTSQRKNK